MYCLPDGETTLLMNYFHSPTSLSKIQLSKKTANWVVTPVGENIVSKSGVHLGNGRPKMKYLIVLPLLLRFAFYPLLSSVSTPCILQVK